MTDKEKRVLTVQSSVVHGYAGARSAVFPLQLHAFEVDVINTVQFSNHTGYGHWTGFNTTAEQILELFQGLEKCEINHFQYLLTGYVPSAAAVEAVGIIGKSLKAKDPKILWLLDPVMGDDGQLYVAGEVVPAYKSIIPYADIIIPNQFEAELLSDRKIDSLDDITAFLKRLHELYRVKHIVISSIQLASHPGFILCCGSTANSAGQPRPFMLKAPIVEGYFVGTGDLFAALLLARLSPYIDQLIPADDVSAVDLPLTKALELVIASVQTVLKSTKVAMNKQLEEDGDLSTLTKKEKQVKIMRAAELRLVQNQDALVHPEVIIQASAL